MCYGSTATTPRPPKLTYWLKTLPCRFCAVIPNAREVKTFDNKSKKAETIFVPETQAWRSENHDELNSQFFQVEHFYAAFLFIFIVL